MSKDVRGAGGQEKSCTLNGLKSLTEYERQLCSYHFSGPCRAFSHVFVVSLFVHTAGKLVQVIWVKSEDQGHRSQFKVTGGIMSLK